MSTFRPLLQLIWSKQIPIWRSYLHIHKIWWWESWMTNQIEIFLSTYSKSCQAPTKTPHYGHSLLTSEVFLVNLITRIEHWNLFIFTNLQTSACFFKSASNKLQDTQDLGYISSQTHLHKYQSRSRLTKEVERKVYHLEWPWKAIPNTPNIIATNNWWLLALVAWIVINIIAILWLIDAY